MSPVRLLEVGRGEVVGYGGEVMEGRAWGIEHGAEYGFMVHLVGGRALTTRSVLTANLAA